MLCDLKLCDFKLTIIVTLKSGRRTESHIQEQDSLQKWRLCLLKTSLLPLLRIVSIAFTGTAFNMRSMALNFPDDQTRRLLTSQLLCRGDVLFGNCFLDR